MPIPSFSKKGGGGLVKTLGGVSTGLGNINSFLSGGLLPPGAPGAVGAVGGVPKGYHVDARGNVVRNKRQRRIVISEKLWDGLIAPLLRGGGRGRPHPFGHRRKRRSHW